MSFRISRLTVAVSARGLSYLGDSVATVALMFRLQSHGALTVAVLLASNLVPIIVLSGVAGRLADAVDERLVLGLSGSAQAVLCCTLVWLDRPAQIFAVVALLGAGQAVNGATWQAVIPALVPPHRLAWALSRSQVAVTVAGIAAPALGGLLVGTSGTRVPMPVDVGSFVVVAACGLMLGRVRGVADPERDRSGGLAIVRRSPVLRATLTLMFWMLLLGCMVNVVEVFLVRSTLHAGAVAYGLCGAVYSSGALVGAVWSRRLGTPARQAAALGYGGVAIGIGLASMGLSPDVGVLVVTSLFTGVSNGIISVTAAALMVGSAAPEARGRVGAVMSGTFSAAQLASYGLAAVLSLALGPRGVFVLGGLTAAVLAAALGGRLRAAVVDGTGRTHRRPNRVPAAGGCSACPPARRTMSTALVHRQRHHPSRGPRRRHSGLMRTAADQVLARHRGVAPRTALLGVLSRAELDDEIRRGRLVRLFRHTFVRPWDAEQPEHLDRAALLSVGSPAALSHTTALRRAGFHVVESERHVTTPVGRGVRSAPGLVVHRESRVPAMQLLDGLPTVTAAVAAVQSWPLLTTHDRRAPVIAAVRTRLTTTEALRQEVRLRTRLTGRQELTTLIELIAAGCESELEIWGLLEVFDVPGLRHGVRQRPITARGRRYVLDLAYEAERVCVELDGDRYHSTRADRDRDRRRDAALATVGWLTLRFSHDRLHADVAGCRRDTLATLAIRRRRLN